MGILEYTKTIHIMTEKQVKLAACTILSQLGNPIIEFLEVNHKKGRVGTIVHTEDPYIELCIEKENPKEIRYIMIILNVGLDLYRLRASKDTGENFHCNEDQAMENIYNDNLGTAIEQLTGLELPEQPFID